MIILQAKFLEPGKILGRQRRGSTFRLDLVLPSVGPAWECVGVAVVVVLIFVFVSFFRPGGRIPAVGRLAQARFPVAYLVGVQGSPMVESSTGLLSAIVGEPIRAGESIRLAHEGTESGWLGHKGVGSWMAQQTPFCSGSGRRFHRARLQKDFPGLPPPSDAVHALFAAVGDLGGEPLLRATRGQVSIRLYSPIGATASDQPPHLLEGPRSGSSTIS